MNSKIEFDSEFCNVKYIEEDNIVFLTWKTFCCLEEYRKPTLFALGLMEQYSNSNFVVDARNGFEDDEADVEWGFSFLLPQMAKTWCKYVVFIMNEVNEIEEEMDRWTKEFKKYFVVKKVKNYSEAVDFILEAWKIFSQNQIDKYLERIKYTKPINMDKKTLDGLQLAHLKSIPYENLDILKGIPLSLEPENLFDKMINKQRGGFCFELNGLYSNLLKSLGFNVTNYVGRFILGESEIQTRRHRILKVEAGEGTYICDVGVRGESTRNCLKFVESEVQTDGISDYKLERDTFYGWILYQRESGKEWRQLYGFTEEPQLDIDFALPCFYCEKHPDSQFISFMKISIFTETNQIALVEDTLKIYQNAKITQETKLESEDEIKCALLSYFGIKMNDLF